MSTIIVIEYPETFSFFWDMLDLKKKIEKHINLSSRSGFSWFNTLVLNTLVGTQTPKWYILTEV